MRVTAVGSLCIQTLLPSFPTEIAFAPTAYRDCGNPDLYRHCPNPELTMMSGDQKRCSTPFSADDTTLGCFVASSRYATFLAIADAPRILFWQFRSKAAARVRLASKDV